MTRPRAKGKTTASRTMRGEFREHHSRSASEGAHLWKVATFVFDTNVLLNIYRYADETREDLLRVIRHLEGRVWVPYAVAREFYARRRDLILAQKGQYKAAVIAVNESIKTLKDG